MKMALVLIAAIAAAALTVWRTQHGAEVWHAAPDAPS